MGKFWAKNGYWFVRLDDGSVRFGRGRSPLFTFDPDTWVSIMSSMSKAGEMENFKKFEELHLGAKEEIRIQ